ncbi:MAG: hypothetical protein WBF55_00065, partial [Syntrophobacteria bacterium]
PRTRGFRLRFQPVGLTGRRVELTARREGRSYPRSEQPIHELSGLVQIDLLLDKKGSNER